MTQSDNNNSSKAAKRVVVVGGGPAGACAAKAMADRGYSDVHLYEAYPPPKSLSKTSSKAYLIALNPRGIRGIRDSTGIDVLAEASATATSDDDEGLLLRGVASFDMVRHARNPRTGATSARKMDIKDHAQCLVPRKALTERLLEAARASGVSIHYRHRLSEIDFEGKTATFRRRSHDDGDGDDDDEVVEVGYDLLLGADGSHSRVRNLMVEAEGKRPGCLGGFRVRTAEDSMEYQVAHLPTNPFGSDHPKGTFHTWNHKGRNAICLGFPTRPRPSSSSEEEEGLMLAIVFPEGNLAAFREKSTTTAAGNGYGEPLADLIPDVPEGSRSAIADQMRENQIGHGGLCVWSSALGHGPSGVALLGDAAHGMWPSLGQGANCALETVAVFASCLDDDDDDDETTAKGAAVEAWTTALVDRYEAARHEDAIAAVDLTYGGIGARESRGRQNAPLSSKLQIGLMILLSKLTGGTVPMPGLLRIMMGDDVSYATAKRWHFHQEPRICGAFAATAFAAIAAAVVGRVLG